MPFLVAAPPGVPPMALALNPLVLLALAAVGGAWTAARSGYASALVLGSPVRPVTLCLWLAAGVALGILVAALDHAAAPLWRTASPPTLREARDGATLLLGLLYGGLTEEVIMRWGLMGVLTAGLMRLMPPSSAAKLALWAAAALFALAHLPAVAVAAGALPVGLLIRTLAWNGLLGLAFGLAFQRAGLEAAILAHMGVHLGFALAALT